MNIIERINGVTQQPFQVMQLSEEEEQGVIDAVDQLFDRTPRNAFDQRSLRALDNLITGLEYGTIAINIWKKVEPLLKNHGIAVEWEVDDYLADMAREEKAYKAALDAFGTKQREKITIVNYFARLRDRK